MAERIPRVGDPITLTCRRCGGGWEYEVKRARRPLYCPPCRPLVHNERGQRWVEANPAKRKVAVQKWLDANPETRAAARERWRLANMEQSRVHRRAAKRRNPQANRANVQRRKARKRGVSVVPFTAGQLAQRLAYYGGHCWMCGGAGETIDHVKPLAAGGAHMLCNLRPACSDCNTRKGSKWPLERAMRQVLIDLGQWHRKM